jgi:hypothetical protein
MTNLGDRYVAALAAKDDAALLGLFCSDVSFRGMTPGRFWEAGSPEEVVNDVLYQWFEPTDVIESVEFVEQGSIADRQRVDYRFRVRNPDGVFAVEQRAYLDVDEAGLIKRMQAICAGYQPIAAEPPESR